jgi:hypothetical protein
MEFKLSTNLISYCSNYKISATDYKLANGPTPNRSQWSSWNRIKLNGHYKATWILQTPHIGYEFDETGMLNQTTVNAPSYTSTKKECTRQARSVCRRRINTWQKSNTYMRIDFALNLFPKKFKKVTIRNQESILGQQLSNEFAIKLRRRNLKTKNCYTNHRFWRCDFLGVEKTLGIGR